MEQPTLRTVAAAAGVSTAAVSYAFNRPDRLSGPVRERILAVARELGYAGPDAAARTLRTGRAGAIGLIFTVGLPYAFYDPYMVDMLGGLAEVAEQYRTGLVLIPFDLGDGVPRDEDELRISLEAVHRAVIDGVIAEGLSDDHPAVLAFAARGIPLVQSSPTQSGRSVLIDDQAAGREVGAHLAGQGHRDVAVVLAYSGGAVTRVDEDKLYPYSRLRLAGLREGLGPDVRVRVLGAGTNAEESGRAAAAVALDARPTAIAADSDVLALGVLDTVRRRGLVPGRDVAVTGFDDVPLAAAVGLTTVRQPIRDRGRLMGRMLLDPGYTAEHVVLPSELVVRSSTAGRPQTVQLTPAPDEWGVQRLDLDAYLRRVGHVGPVDADEATLVALHRAHIAAIPFENLDVILGRGVSVDLADVQAKLVRAGRGGYCYEHAILFAAVLTRLGLRVDRLLGRVGDPAEHSRPRSHLVVRVEVGGRWWLADVGFGSGLLLPLPLAEEAPHRQGAWEYRLWRGYDGGWWLREHDGERWTTIQTFTEEPEHLADIEAANFNTAKNPASPFTRRPIVVRKDETSVRRLLGRTYTLVRPGRPDQTRTVPDDEYGAVLADEFRLALAPDDVMALTATLDE